MTMTSAYPNQNQNPNPNPNSNHEQQQQQQEGMKQDDHLLLLDGYNHASTMDSNRQPSIVSMASDGVFDAPYDPEQLVDSTLSDLFEGALCDDELNEIPNLLNLASGIPTEQPQQQQLQQLQQQQLQQVQQPAPMMMAAAFPQAVYSAPPATSSPAPVEILPAQVQTSTSNSTMMVPDPNRQLRLQQQQQKRGLQQLQPNNTSSNTSNSNKRSKMQTNSYVTNPVVMQSIRPLTQLPSSMEVVVAGPSIVGSSNINLHVSNQQVSNSNTNINTMPSNCNNTSSHTKTSSNNNNGINTSTNHIKALTGANGAAVCLEAIEKALEDASKQKKNNGGATASIADSSLTNSTAGTDTTTASTSTDNTDHLSPEEKAKHSRDRNRQHARNTRVRKKAYVEELKRTLNSLVEERDAVVQASSMRAAGVVEQRDVRFRVLQDFLHLRGRNESDPHRWALILEDSFYMTLPRADIPGVVCSSGGPEDTSGTNSNNQQSYPLGTTKKVLTGVHQVMEDSRMVLNLLQSLGASRLSVSYHCDRDSFLMDETNVVLKWVATSSGAVTKGANAEFSIGGTASAKFNPLSNKLLSLEFTF